MKNKRFLAACMMCVVMTTSALTGCSNKNNDKATEAPTKEETTIDDQTEGAVDNSENADGESATEAVQEEASSASGEQEVTLGDYHAFTYHYNEEAVTDADVDAEVDKIMESNVADPQYESTGTVAEGDHIKLSYTGSIDGKEMSELSATDDETVVGSADLTEELDHQLIGLTVGDETDITVTFPEDYWQTDVAGKTAIFKVTVTARADAPEVPELTDAWVTEHTDFTSADEYKAEMRKDLEAQAAEKAKSAAIYELITQLMAVSDAKVEDSDVQGVVEKMTDMYKEEAKSNNVSYEEYLSSNLGTTPEVFADSLESEAKEDARRNKILDAYIAVENIDVSDEAFDSYATEQAEMYGYEDGKSLISDMDIAGYADYFRSIFKETKVGEHLMQFAHRIDDETENTSEAVEESVQADGDELTFEVTTEAATE